MQLNIHVYAAQVKNRQHYQNEKISDIKSVKLRTMLLGDLADSTHFCSLIQNMDVDEDSEKNLDLELHMMSAWVFYSSLGISDFLSSADNISNSLDPDQDQRNVDPDLDLNHLTLW